MLQNGNKILFGLNRFLLGTHEFTSIYLKQVGATTLIKGASIIISIFYVPLALGFLEQEKYGIWVALSTIVNWVRLLDIGMGNGMRNKVAESIALKNHDQGRIHISTTYAFLGMVFISFLVLFFLFNPYLNWQEILNTSSISAEELTRLTSIAVTFIVLGFIFQPVTLVYASHGDTATGGVLQLVISLLTLFLIWLATQFAEKGDIIIMAWIVTGVPILVYILFSIYTYLKKYKHLRPSIRYVRFRESRHLISLSGQFFIVQITAAILFSSIPFVITQLFSPKEVATFNIATSIFNLPPMLMAIITAPGHSLVTQSYAKRDFDWMKQLLKNQLIVSAGLVLLTCLMIIVSPTIYKLWLGDKITIPFGLSVAVGVYAIIHVLNAPFSTFINAIGKLRILIVLAPVGIVMFLGLSVILSNILQDVIAISIALSLTSFVNLIFIPLALKKIIRIEEQLPFKEH